MNIVLHGRSGHEFLFPGIKASDSRSRIMRMDFPWLFPGMIAPDSLSRIVGMDFFIPFRSLIFGNDFLSHSCSQNLEMFYILAFPKFWGCFFSISFPKTSGAEIFIPFPFLNSKKSFPLIPFTEGGGGWPFITWGGGPLGPPRPESDYVIQLKSLILLYIY